MANLLREQPHRRSLSCQPPRIIRELDHPKFSQSLDPKTDQADPDLHSPHRFYVFYFFFFPAFLLTRPPAACRNPAPPPPPLQIET